MARRRAAYDITSRPAVVHREQDRGVSLARLGRICTESSGSAGDNRAIAGLTGGRQESWDADQLRAMRAAVGPEPLQVELVLLKQPRRSRLRVDARDDLLHGLVQLFRLGRDEVQRRVAEADDAAREDAFAFFAEDM